MTVSLLATAAEKKFEETRNIDSDNNLGLVRSGRQRNVQNRVFTS